MYANVRMLEHVMSYQIRLNNNVTGKILSA